MGRVWSIWPGSLRRSAQHGIISRAQLLDAGVGPAAIKRWVNAGRLIVIHRGVYALGHLPPSPHARTMAAVLACGPGAALSHRSAATPASSKPAHRVVRVTWDRLTRGGQREAARFRKLLT